MKLLENPSNFEPNCFMRKDGQTKGQTDGYDGVTTSFTSLGKRTKKNTNFCSPSLRIFLRRYIYSLVQV